MEKDDDFLIAVEKLVKAQDRLIAETSDGGSTGGGDGSGGDGRNYPAE
jgi:hypothetical protein